MDYKVVCCFHLPQVIWSSSVTGLVITPATLERPSRHLVKPELTGGSHLPHPAQIEEEEGRERAREAHQRPTLRVRQTADDLSVPFVLYCCICVHCIFVLQ